MLISGTNIANYREGIHCKMLCGKPWNLDFASLGKSRKTVFYCLYELWVRVSVKARARF